MKPRLRKGVKNFSTQDLFQHGPYGRSIDEFIEIAKMKYGNYYSYKNVVYRYAKYPVEIICKKHGPFSRPPHDFFKGLDCPQCRKLEFYGPARIKKIPKPRVCWNKNYFLQKAKEVHGKKYDYSETGDISSRTQQITIICPKHGKFRQRVSAHLNGSGCWPCGNEKKGMEKVLPFAEFLRRARKAHGKKFEYVEASYTGIRFPITIICPIHGKFSQSGINHTNRGHGCPKCSRLAYAQKRKLSFDEFVQRSRKVHKNKYRYIKTTYDGGEKKMTIVCPIHGEFEQSPHSHLAGRECKLCGTETARKKLTGQKRKKPFSVFEKSARKVHKNKYQYVEASYINNHAKVTVICPIHGEFQQIAKTHLNGSECPLCAHKIILVRHNGKMLTLAELAHATGVTRCTLAMRYNKGIRGSELVKPQKRKNRYYNYNGKQYRLKELAQLTGTNESAIKNRYRKGLRGNELVTPFNANGNSQKHGSGK